MNVRSAMAVMAVMAWRPLESRSHPHPSSIGLKSVAFRRQEQGEYRCVQVAYPLNQTGQTPMRAGNKIKKSHAGRALSRFDTNNGVRP